MMPTENIIASIYGPATWGRIRKFVYFFGCGWLTKIGTTQCLVSSKQVRPKLPAPMPLRFIGGFIGSEMDERTLHACFADERVYGRHSLRA